MGPIGKDWREDLAAEIVDVSWIVLIPVCETGRAELTRVDFVTRLHAGLQHLDEGGRESPGVSAAIGTSSH